MREKRYMENGLYFGDNLTVESIKFPKTWGKGNDGASNLRTPREKRRLTNFN
jgi:hypothetical protein